jgi:hypothetical protein
MTETPRTALTMYLGAGEPRWLETAPADVPLFVSASRLARYRRSGDHMPHARRGWALDSGGFTELQQHGEWSTDPDEFGGMVTRFADECGAPPEWCAPQDWMCEPWVMSGGVHNGITFAGTGLDVATHQELTVDNLVYLRREFYFLPWVPVLQGWSLPDYLRCVEMYAAAGVDLTTEPLVGLGSVCRRESTAEIEAIVRALWDRGIRRMHGFGVKSSGLRRYGRYLVSADSQAWSKVARRERYQLPGCDHPGGDCRNCQLWAVEWRRRVLAGLPDTPEPEQGQFALWGAA